MDDAADRVDSFRDACGLLAEEEPTVQSVIAFTDLLQGRFWAVPGTEPAPVTMSLLC